jgi:hypothetical protein
MAKKMDEKTLSLIKEVNKRKAEIASLERPNWKTNCSFSYIEDKIVYPINIHVESSVMKLVSIAGFLMERENSYKEAAEKFLGLEAPEFLWMGFSVEDWISDIKTRIDKIQIADKRKKLDTLESRLNQIVSPELRAKLELEAIEAELK